MHLMNTRGLVTRPPAREDERVAIVTIPDTGPALLAKVFPDHIEVLNQLLFEPLSREDAKAVADLLAPVRDHVRSVPPCAAVANKQPCSSSGRRQDLHAVPRRRRRGAA
jgi:hypothetical protein